MSPDSNEPLLLHDFLERSLAVDPDGIAIDVPPGRERPRRRITYAELDRRAGAIHARLTALVEPGSVVAILIPRHDTDAFAAQLAVLRAGCAYTCIDAAFPDAHATFVVEDSGARVLVTDHSGAVRARSARFPVAHVVELDDGRAAAAGAAARCSPGDLAYVIYTSGTTGRPKGVMIEHRSIVNLIASDIESFGLTRDDRVAQGSSHAYDSAVEETWLAFASGATLVVLDDETARLGPDLIPWLKGERISVFCPPPTQLRATGCRDPEHELPDLRLLYVGGEALPRDIADRWARGRHMENGYGPTECTVTVLRGRVLENGPVTIGSPVTGNRAIVLDESGVEIEDDRPGELCLSGASLARGYLNRPELTLEKFPLHPRLGRIYRTGDLVRRESDGRFSYLGRVDSQVKLRGYRIELSAIEALLAGRKDVRAAACTLQEEAGGPILVAFVVPVDASAPPSEEELKACLARDLPSYMVPARLALAEALPVSVGGKLDRSKLPRIAARGADEGRSIVEPRNAIETVVRDALRSSLGLAEGPSITDDFFLDAGGDSLRAAEAVSLLRAHPLTAHVTVRDVYAARTIAAIAAIEPPRPPSHTERPRARRVSGIRLAAANAMQMMCLLATIVGASALAVWVGEGLSHSILATADLPLVLALSPFAVAIVLFGYAPCSIAFAVLLKRILVGRYSAGRVPVFSGFYVRHWIVQKAARAIPWDSLSGTEFECRALRALGARIGRRVHIHRGVRLDQGGWDLLDIGDDATLAQDAALRLVDLENGELLVGPVKIGSGATVDVRGGMSADSSLGSGAFLGALSWLPGGYHVPDGARFDGVPARAAGRAPDVAEVDDDREWSPDAYALALVTARATMRCLFAVPLTALVALLAWRSGVDLAGLARVLVNGSWSGFETFLLALAACAAIPATLLLQALFLRAIGNVPAGSVKRTSPAHLRIVLKTEVVQSAGTWISGTLFWPVWLRLAGMRVGRSAEVSTILGVVPELVEIGEESFLADGIYLGCPRLHRGVVTAALTTLGQRTFLGNHVVVLAGHRLKDDLLVGVCTVTAPESMRSNSAWFGHPPFELPRRPQSDFDRSLTHDPNLVLRCTRIAWELLRFALPFPAVFVASWSATWLANQHLGEQAFARDTLQLAALAVLVATSGPLFVWALKWILLGRVRPGQHPLWSSWCSRWDFHYVVWALYARAALSALEGTSFLAWYLRAMGCKVGRGVVLAGGFAQVVDPDMLEFEDGATVHALFQAHSFEERVLKIDRVRVGRDSNVGPGAVLFFGAEIGEGARVLPHSVVMKHERVPAWRTYVGCPVHETDG